ncbi:unnamed protein product [Fraxinus pennsylvanica]|uniref:Uncharacterized protein n=1 Tax=Fraxinus pennsylvanica TaxID=56036 RepID=A0AAD1Z0B2_9LAMI|nr:unnamed protein product [Fraxinus pennsylvanica]
MVLYGYLWYFMRSALPRRTPGEASLEGVPFGGDSRPLPEEAEEARRRQERCLQFWSHSTELLTLKKAIDFNREEANVNLVIMDEEKLMHVVDQCSKKGMKAIGNLAAACMDERTKAESAFDERSG